MKKLRKVSLIFFTIISCVIYSSASFGQPGPCSDPDGGPCCDADGNYNPDLPTCPIDGGVIALLAAGIGLGIKRVIRDSRKEIIVND